MRLTSLNIAKVRLKAGCCLSDMVDRMWAYMDEGDTENARCVREKALVLSGLIKALCRWRPTIVNAGRSTLVGEIESGTFPIPYLYAGTSTDGLPTSNPFMVLSGGNPEVVTALLDAINCFISPNDDLVQTISVRRIGPEKIEVTTDFAEGVNFLIADFPDEVTWSFSGGGESITNTPHCLTDSQVLSIIKKIDELCGCNCKG
jgi:hypothetical protein